MKRKNLALRMSAYMMSALLVVGSAAPTYAAEEVTFADEATDIAVEDTGEGETEVTEDEFADLDLERPALQNAGQLDLLTHSVNPVRLKNNPVQLDEETLEELYRQILRVQA